MKQFFNFFAEAKTSQASIQAERRGWTGDGHGSWYDREGNLVAKTERGQLKLVDRKKAPPKEEAPKPKTKKSEEEPKESKPKTIEPTADGNGPSRADGSPKEDRGEVTVVFGRFNPPTIGHQKLLDAAKKAAGKGAMRIYPSRSQDKKKNPLDPDSKHDYMSKMFPDHASNMVNDPNARTIFDVLKQAHEDGYSSVKIVAGGSRVGEFDKLSKEYNGRLYNFKGLETVSAGERDPDAEGVEGVSASKLRKAAAEDDFEEFRKGIPKNLDTKVAKQLFNTVRRQMKLLEGWNLWEIAPDFDWKNLRENYVNGTIFKVNEWVENLNTGLVGKVIRRGTNYLICVTEDNIMFKSWVKDLKETEKYGDDEIERAPGKPNTLVGTTGYLKYAMKMMGVKDVKNFINKNKKKK